MTNYEDATIFTPTKTTRLEDKKVGERLENVARPPAAKAVEKVFVPAKLASKEKKAN